MAKTVEEGFRIFHQRLIPTCGESEAAERHRLTIKQCLMNNYGMTRFFKTGSFGNGTSIHGYSDVDYFAVIPTENLNQNSASTLRKIRNTLDVRFPYTGVTVRKPAVLVPFGTNGCESTEVVPADDINKTIGGYKIYEIPNSFDGWMRTSPDAQNAYVTEVNKALSKKVKPLIRFAKAWKFLRNVPISSIYLEMKIAKYAYGEDRIQYSYDVRKILKILRDCGLASLHDPVGISGYIHPCNTEAKREDALSKIETALIRADKARNAEQAGKIQDAFYWWNMVFAEKFPAY